MLDRAVTVLLILVLLAMTALVSGVAVAVWRDALR